MIAKFEFIDEYKECGLSLPVRETQFSAGYDLAAAEDIVIPSYFKLKDDMINYVENRTAPLELKDMANITSALGTRPTLVPTGLTCKLDPNYYLSIVPRSSTPLKHWLMVANSPGIIDADYYSRHIYILIYNLSPFDTLIKKGERIAQAIILPYKTTDDDNLTYIAARTRIGGLGSTTV